MNYRKAAEEIFLTAVKSVHPVNLIEKNMTLEKNTLRISGRNFDLTSIDKIFLIGAGKASGSMALAVERILGSRINGGCVIVKYGHAEPLKYASIREAGHPVPDRNGFEATGEIVRIVSGSGPDDLVICLISGGGSALLADCPEGIAREDLARMNQLLVNCGAAIDEINTVRKHVSDVKGGRLASLVYPSKLINLILSDVPDNSPEIIASGPTYPDSSTYMQALDIIHKSGIKEKMPQAVLYHLEKGLKGLVPESPRPGDRVFDRTVNFLLGTNRTALDEAAFKSGEMGLNCCYRDYNLKGDTGPAAELIASLARKIKDDHSIGKPAVALLGGETTINVTGSGLGGRNQHLALWCSVKLAGMKDVTVLAAGTDGNDGPTDAAGAVVDGDTARLAAEKGIDPRMYFDNFDSYNFFRQAGGHIITGPTMTNVMDLVVLVIG